MWTQFKLFFLFKVNRRTATFNGPRDNIITQLHGLRGFSLYQSCLSYFFPSLLVTAVYSGLKINSCLPSTMELPNVASSLLRQCPFPLCHLETKAAWETDWNQTLWSAYLSNRTAISATEQDLHVSTTRRQVAVRHVQACKCDWLTDRNTREILPFTCCFFFSRVLCRNNALNLQSATAMTSIWRLFIPWIAATINYLWKIQRGRYFAFPVVYLSHPQRREPLRKQ